MFGNLVSTSLSLYNRNIDRKGTYQPDNVYVDPATGEDILLDSTVLPDNAFLWSPRLGFNWDVKGNNTIQVNETPEELTIYPNPMINSATISMDLAKESTVSISLINMMGQTVSSIVENKNLSSGNSTFEINKNNLSSGVYFVKINVNGKSRMEKLVIN